MPDLVNPKIATKARELCFSQYAVLQIGKAITQKYLAAAMHVFGNDSFHYVREVKGAHDAVLEFELELDGIRINGVDMIKWNEAGQVTEFKVLLRPLKAVNLIHEKMAAMLQAGR